MKKIISILLLTFMGQMSYADGTPNGINPNGYDKGEKGHPHKAPKKPSTPVISYNQGVLSVSTDNALYDAEIVIRDIDGNIIYDVVDTISNGYAILLPTHVFSKMQSVELIHLGNYYIFNID